MWRWPAACQHAPRCAGAALASFLMTPQNPQPRLGQQTVAWHHIPSPFPHNYTLSNHQDGGIARSHRIFSEMSVLSSRTGRSRGNLPKVFRWLVVSVADPGGVNVCRGVITPGLPLAPVPLTSTSRRLRVEDGRESLGDGNPLLPLRPGDGNGIVMSTGVPWAVRKGVFGFEEDVV